MKVSVYTSLFNVDNDLFDVEGAIKNWKKYADELIIATFEDQEFDICKKVGKKKYIRVVGVDTSLDDPFFDGKLKNAALQECSNDIVIQQDFDERIGGYVEQWEGLRQWLVRNPDESAKAWMIPVIDLYKDLDHFKGLGAKWYMHRKEGCYRGPVNFAKRIDGTIDTDKSDTCELIDEQGNLVPFLRDDRFGSSVDRDLFFNPVVPHVIHLGYLDLKKRVDNNKFWGPVWSARNGADVKIATDVEEIEEENKTQLHKLKREWWK